MEGRIIGCKSRLAKISRKVFLPLPYGSGRGNRKLEAYATWGMLPACLPAHRQRVVPKQLTNFFIRPMLGLVTSPTRGFMPDGLFKW